MQIKTGLGYDIHRLVEGRKCVLGGVTIPYEKGLDGHSDADVVLHALCDAILGALGYGDIGEHFPNTDPAYKDISSVTLLEKVEVLLREDGFKVSNIDIMIQAEAPKVNPHKEKMCINIANTLNIPQADINIKATTQEGLGAIGNKEGIAAFANVLIYRA